MTKSLVQAVHWAQYCTSNNINASCFQGSKHIGRYRSRSKPQECALHTCVQLHDVQQYHMYQTAYSACQQFIACTDSQEAYLPVCYDQWWTSHVAGSTTSHTYYSSWKEAIAFSFVHWKLARERGRQQWLANDARTLKRSVFSESHTLKHNKEPYKTLFSM